MKQDKKWLESYETARKEGKLAAALDYGALFNQKEFGGHRLYKIQMGNLTFPTGEFLVCDPLVYLTSDTRPYVETVQAGTYPLETLVSEYEGDVRYAVSRVRFTEAKAAEYCLALDGTEDLSTLQEEGDFFGFPVDAGLAAIVDVQTRDAYCAFEKEWDAAHEDGNIYDDFLTERFDENAKNAPDFQREGGDWLNLHIPGSELQIPFIQSGYGDGYYPVYFGFDAAGAVCELVVDYLVLDAPVYS